MTWVYMTQKGSRGDWSPAVYSRSGDKGLSEGKEEMKRESHEARESDSPHPTRVYTERRQLSWLCCPPSSTQQHPTLVCTGGGECTHVRGLVVVRGRCSVPYFSWNPGERGCSGSRECVLVAARCPSTRGRSLAGRWCGCTCEDGTPCTLLVWQSEQGQRHGWEFWGCWKRSNQAGFPKTKVGRTRF